MSNLDSETLFALLIGSGQRDMIMDIVKRAAGCNPQAFIVASRIMLGEMAEDDSARESIQMLVDLAMALQSFRNEVLSITASHELAS